MKKNKKTFGFTMIEMLVFLSILIIILSISFLLLLTTFNNSAKAEALKEIRQNGDFAISSIERYLVSAKSAECLTEQSLLVTKLDGETINFICQNDTISSGSASLTNDQVVVSDCHFVCTFEEGLAGMVNISFTMSTGEENLRSSEKASLPFETKVLIRNQKN